LRFFANLANFGSIFDIRAPNGHTVFALHQEFCIFDQKKFKKFLEKVQKIFRKSSKRKKLVKIEDIIRTNA